MKRYAIYYAPEPGPFAAFGAAWLGWDAENGVLVPHPEIDATAIGLSVAELTTAPRKYGLHGTLKAPFRVQGTQADLEDGITALCAGLSPVTLEGLELADLAGFLALRPLGDLTGLNDLAARIVTGLDPHRAPLTEAEIARRKPGSLTAHQRQMLEQWGYPHVLDGFRFHITLTDSLPAETLAKTRQILRPMLEPLLPRPFVIDQICLFGEQDDGWFRLLRRYPLGHGTTP
ncbi:DUF1045 domain-containing protein [Paracoccus caeni]|uniref:DUF1045 domain-containing protein n=1 Tax=Paracoccus caeni TaxID=657651 RepID=A0A934VVF7_9RHOB|nr:DUF1045 domain-containing protein [Paracoccus caeni]MBK4216901.1 DUF1045 domain-containing protein [Paracoccus caeni]